MTHYAHGTQRSHGHASRTRDMYTPQTPCTFFDDLHPHLRNVVVGQQTLAERIHGYLLRRGPRTLRQLSDKMGGDTGRVKRCLLANEALFERVGKVWMIRGVDGNAM